MIYCPYFKAPVASEENLPMKEMSDTAEVFFHRSLFPILPLRVQMLRGDLNRIVPGDPSSEAELVPEARD